jgi:VWFA-related protein
MTTSCRGLAVRFSGLAGSVLLAGSILMGAAGQARADVNLRVEARPADEPIDVNVRVTDDINGTPVIGLDASDFLVTIDGESVTIGGLTLPPEQDAAQTVSVVFAMDYSGSVVNAALPQMQQAIIEFAESMRDGDQIAIIKFNDTNPARASVVLPFTTVDHGANNALIEAAVLEDYPGDGTNILDALDLAVNQFVSPPTALPVGPKAVILVSDGGENNSLVTESEVVALANANSIPLFMIGVGDLANLGNEELLTSLSTETGGQYYPTSTDEEIQAAYADISLLLTQEYLITIPNGIADCAVHVLEVTVAGQAAPASAQFTRRTCDTEPNAFTFTSLTNLRTDSSATSNSVTVTGIEVPAQIAVLQGRYSIGCNDTFTTDPGTISDGQTVCVRHQTSELPSTSQTTTLTIGGVAGTFTSTTAAAGGGGAGGGGGGGASGLFELALALGLLLLARRRTA